MWKGFRYGLFAALTAVMPAAFATDIVHYDNKPVSIQLSVGTERTIQFGDHVQVGVTRAQEGANLFRVQSAQGAVHIRANQPFDAQRLQIKRMGDGRIVLLDLTAVPAGDAPMVEDVRVLMPDEDTVAGVARGDVEAEAPTISPVTLTRYASQQLYGPSRLHMQIPGINAVPVGPVGDRDFRLFKGLAAAHTASRAFVAYQGGPYHLAAILITNTSDLAVTLDYRDLNVPFTHATFQHHRLAPAGQPADRTVLYLITDRSLAETLVPWDFYALAEETAP